jgi:hypothetical protein
VTFATTISSAHPKNQVAIVLLAIAQTMWISMLLEIAIVKPANVCSAFTILRVTIAKFARMDITERLNNKIVEVRNFYSLLNFK